MAIAKSFRELEVYNMARSESFKILQLTKLFPKEERYSLTDQIRRSSRAVGAMVAAAWARRRYKAAFISKLDEALEEATETQAWLDSCLDAGYISGEQFRDSDIVWQHVGGKLVSMMNRADDFCKLASNYGTANNQARISTSRSSASQNYSQF